MEIEFILELDRGKSHMEKTKAYIMIALKIFISFTAPMLILFIGAELILKMNVDWRFLIIFSLAISFSGAPNYKQKSVEISIDDKDSFIIDMKEKLDYSQWKIISDNKENFIVQPRFDRPYSWMYKEKVIIDMRENHVNLQGTKLYVDKIKATIDNERSIWDKKSVRYFGKTVLVLMILIPILMHLGVIDRGALRKTYHEFKVRNIEKINFEENFILGNTEDNINNYGGAVVKEDYIFYVKDNSSIYRADKNFNNEALIIKESSGSGIWYLNVIEDWLFYREGKAIKRIKIDGSEKDTIFNLGYALDIHVLDNWLYFQSFHDGFKVYKMTVNGEYLQRVIDISVSDIAIYDNKLYYSYGLDEVGYLKYMDLDNGEEQLVANLHVRDMIIEDSIVYYIDYNDNKLYQYNLLNKLVKSLTEDEITKFLKGEEWIYFMGKGEDDFHPGKGLYRINLDDNSKEMIHDNWFMEKINIVGDWILYISSSKDKQPPSLKRIHTDGSAAIEMDSGF